MTYCLFVSDRAHFILEVYIRVVVIQLSLVLTLYCCDDALIAVKKWLPTQSVVSDIGKQCD